MGVSTDAILAFGFDLDEELPESFEEVADGEDFEFSQIINKESGILPFDWEAATEKERSANYDLTRKAEEAFPLDLIMHCSYDYPMYFLSIRGTESRASRGNPREITIPDIGLKKIEAMKAFCEKYGIEWREPKWHLFSMCGGVTPDAQLQQRSDDHMKKEVIAPTDKTD